MWGNGALEKMSVQTLRRLKVMGEVWMESFKDVCCVGSWAIGRMSAQILMRKGKGREMVVVLVKVVVRVGGNHQEREMVDLCMGVVGIVVDGILGEIAQEKARVAKVVVKESEVWKWWMVELVRNGCAGWRRRRRS